MIFDSRISLLSFVTINLIRFTLSMSACHFVTFSSPSSTSFIHTCTLSCISTPSTAPPPCSPDTPKCRTLYQRWQRTWGNKTREQGFQEESERVKERKWVKSFFLTKNRLPSVPTFGTMGATEWQRDGREGKKHWWMNEWINEWMLRKGRTRDRGKKKCAPGSLSACPLLATRDEPQCG